MSDALDIKWSKEDGLLSGDPEAMPKLIAAQRLTIAQQAQEIEQLKAVHQQLTTMYHTDMTNAANHLTAMTEERDAITQRWKQEFELRCKEEDTNAQLRARLPKEMQDCTILFKECPYGHGRLTATNWVDHGCGVCKLAQLQSRLTASEAEHKDELRHYQASIMQLLRLVTPAPMESWKQSIIDKANHLIGTQGPLTPGEE